MESKIQDYIKKLEEKLFRGYHLKIFKGFKASNQTGAQKVINELYENLDENVEKAKKDLDR